MDEDKLLKLKALYVCVNNLMRTEYKHSPLIALADNFEALGNAMILLDGGVFDPEGIFQKAMNAD